LLKLSLQNYSEFSIIVDKFIIATDDAYMNPSWAPMYAFPCDNKPVLKKSTSNRNGYVLSFDSKMVLPSGTNMDLCVAFPEEPIVQTKNSFVQIIDDTKKERSLKLTQKVSDRILDIKLQFARLVSIIFFVILGVVYFIIIFISYKRSKANIPKKDVQQ
jgi:hypothetical protein